MKKLIVRNIKVIVSIIITMVLCVVGTVYAASKYLASDVIYKDTTVEKALNELYDKKNICDDTLVGTEWYYSYIGKEQIFIPMCTGKYKIELWGAQGYSGSWAQGGKGAYTSGITQFNSSDKIYVYIGGSGNNKGYNGGGIGDYYGGGSTDIRVDYNKDKEVTLLERIMVASGGSGGYNFSSSWYRTGISGGTINGKNGAVTTGRIPTGGTQISGGIGNFDSLNGTFGHGGNNNNFNTAGTGGGGGYYGGGATSNIGSSTETGGSGSSFISGHDGCDAIDEKGNHTGQSNHYSKIIFSDTNMISGDDTMPSYDGETSMVGNKGNGYAKITLISLK